MTIPVLGMMKYSLIQNQFYLDIFAVNVRNSEYVVGLFAFFDVFLNVLMKEIRILFGGHIDEINEIEYFEVNIILLQVNGIKSMQLQ